MAFKERTNTAVALTNLKGKGNVRAIKHYGIYEDALDESIKITNIKE